MISHCIEIASNDDKCCLCTEGDAALHHHTASQNKNQQQNKLLGIGREDSTLLLNLQMRCHLRGNKQACWLYKIYYQEVLLRQINDQPNTNSPFFVLSVFIVRFNPSTAENRCSVFLQNLLIGSISFVSRLLAPMSGLLIFVSLICVTLCQFYWSLFKEAHFLCAIGFL